MRLLWQSALAAGSRLKGKPYLSILIYHQILPELDELRFDGVDAKQFAQQMLWVKDHFNVLPLRTALRLMAKNKLPSRALCITFDDGYLDNYTVALPILKKIGLPASFYISSGMLGGNRMWHDDIIDAVRLTKLPKIELADKNYSLNGIGDKIEFLRFFEDYYKSLPINEANTLLDDLLHELGQPPDRVLFMDADQVRKMAQEGMEVGSHGRTHRILTSISDQEAEYEIAKSKCEIEAIVENEVSGFVYPNGKAPADFSAHHSSMVRKAGYEYALATNYGCSNQVDEKYKLKRFTPWRKTKNGFLLSMFLNYWYYQEKI